MIGYLGRVRVSSDGWMLWDDGLQWYTERVPPIKGCLFQPNGFTMGILIYVSSITLALITEHREVSPSPHILVATSTLASSAVGPPYVSFSTLTMSYIVLHVST